MKLVGGMTSAETANEEVVCLELPAPSGWKKKVIHSLFSFSFNMRLFLFFLLFMVFLGLTGWLLIMCLLVWYGYCYWV